MMETLKETFVLIFLFFKYLSQVAYHSLPTIMMSIAFINFIWGDMLPALCCWIISELMQIKNRLEEAEIIVRKED